MYKFYFYFFHIISIPKFQLLEQCFSGNLPPSFRRREVVDIPKQSGGAPGPGGLFPPETAAPRSASSPKRGAAAAVAKRPALW